MSQDTNRNSVNRRKVLSSIAAGAATTSMVGIGSASDTDQEPDLSEAEREELRSEYDDLEKARRTLVENTEPVRRRLEEKELIPSASAERIRTDRIAETLPEKQESVDTIRVRPTWNPKRERGVVIIDTTIETRDGAVLLTTNTATDDAFAFVFDEDGLVTVLGTPTPETHDATGETVSTLSDDTELICGDVCDDCCGWTDCSAEVEAEIIIGGISGGTGCGCVEGGGLPSPYCCESESCSGTIPCSCR